MDYHFLRPRGLARPGTNRNITKLVTRFLPVFLLAAILPFLIGFVVAPPDISFLTRADATSELRVWIEPANVVMSPGTSTEVSVIAQFGGEGKLVPEVSLALVGTGSVEVTNQNITHSIPFSGRVELARVTVSARSPGTGQVTIPRDSVKVTAFEWPLEVNTAGSNVIVR